MSITTIQGGVCAPQGFQASGLHCGLAKKADKKDLALIYSTAPCTAAATCTTNLVKAAPVLVTQKHLQDHKAQAVVCNSGNANACNANGEEVAIKTCAAVAKELGIQPGDVVVASTGVIGQPLPVEKIEAAVPALVQSLSENGSDMASQAILTTDLIPKEIAVEFQIGGKTCRMGGIAKGSGMIHPNMATMLGFITTDLAVAPELLQKGLSLITNETFNMVSVDGDTSTNDMAVVLANGLSGAVVDDETSDSYKLFLAALRMVCGYLGRMMAKDGEGATKLLECVVTGAPDHATAQILAKSVITSSLVKTAMFGADANWGRILCSLGYAGADFDISKTEVTFRSPAGSVLVCKDGAGVAFSEEIAKEVLLENEIEILVSLHQGSGKATAWGCDLSYDYVKINGDYRS